MTVSPQKESDYKLTFRRVLAAFLFGTSLTALVYPPVCFLLKLLLDSLTREIPLKTARPLDLLILAVSGLGLGIFLALNQMFVLRLWIHRRAAWLITSGLAMMLFIPGVMFLMQRLAFLPPNTFNFYSLPVDLAKQIESSVAAWGWIGGAACGLAGGLLFGLVQSPFLPRHRRLWWLLNGAVWALLAGTILSFLNVNNLIFAWGPWGD